MPKGESKALEIEERRDREGTLPRALQVDDLVASEVATLIVAVLRGATVEWRRSNPRISDFLRL